MRAERELAELGRSRHATHRETHRPSGLVFATVKRLDRNRRRSLDTEQDRGIRRRADLPRERRTQHRLPSVAAEGRGGCHLVKLPEPIIDAVHQHTLHPPVAALVGDHSLQLNERTDTHERGFKRGGGTKIVGECLPEETRRHHRTVGLPQARQHQVPQAPAHGLTDQERPREHGDSGCDT